VESLSLGRGLDHADADAKVAEPLAVVALHGVPLEGGLEDRQNLLFVDGASVELVKAVAVVAASEVQLCKSRLVKGISGQVSSEQSGFVVMCTYVVETVRLSYHGNLGQPRPGTAVGTSGHAHDDAILSHA